MVEVYEYRQSSRGQVVALSAAAVAFVLAFGIVAEIPNIFVLASCLTGALIGWMLMMGPVRGIRVDDTHLVLNAWRRPREILLEDIAYLRTVHWTEDSEVTIVYRDGTEESTNPRDLPDINTLAQVLRARGVKVKDPGLIG